MILPFLFSDRDNQGLCVWDFMKTDRISALKEVNNDLDFFRFQASFCPHKLGNSI